MNALYRIKGTRKSTTSTVEFDDAVVFVTYPDSRTWVADITLEPGRTTYSYRQLTDGVYSSWQSVEISYGGNEFEERAASNTLDQYGVLFDTQRLTGETNKAYRDRLKDVFVHRGGPQFDGIVNSICRDLGLSYVDNALIVNASNNPRTGQPWDGLRFSIWPTTVRVSLPVFRKVREALRVDPVTMLVSPSETISAELVVEDQRGQRLSPSEWTFDPDHNQVHFLLSSYGGQVMYLSYTYEKRVSRTDKTVQEVADELEAIETPQGDQVLDVSVNEDAADESAEGLSIIPPTNPIGLFFDAGRNETEGLPVRWSAITLFRLSDEEFVEQNRSSSGSLWNTRLSSYALAIRKLSRSTWDYAVADESIWSSPDVPLEGGQFVESICDVPLGEWHDPTTGTSFDHWHLEFSPDTLDTEITITYNGIVASDVQSGIGCGLDLKVVVGSEGAGLTAEEEGSHFVAVDDTEVSIPDGSSPETGGSEIP